MNHLEQNKLIALFMGHKYIDRISWLHMRIPGKVKVGYFRLTEYNNDVQGNICHFNQMLYHTSWDWLMPSWKLLYPLLLKLNYTSLIDEFKNAVTAVDIELAHSIVIKGIQLINA